MDYSLKLLYFFAFLGGSVIFIYTLYIIYQNIKLKKILALPFKKEYKEYLKNTPYYEKLPPQDKEKIEKSILIFINTKQFIGIGLDITEEMKVIIAFYACLLLLHKNSCYENLNTIIVYPTAMIVSMLSHSNGIYTKDKFLIDGQSSNDTVIISWHDAKKEAYHLRYNNVIIHEFTHEIDFMSGEINGVPPLEKSKYHEWVQILFDDFKKLNNVALKNRDWNKYKILGSYAATNEAEFFAVVTERFFESPKVLKKHFPELYKELKEFYEIDPVKLLQV